MPTSPRDRATRLRRAVRRAVLARRRSLAAVLAAVGAAAGVHAASAPPPALVPVRVAAADLPAGEVLSNRDLTTVEFAPGSVPAHLADDPAGSTLAAPLRRGEPVTDLRLVGPALTQGRPGLRAVPVRLPDAAMVDLLVTGDRIDLLAADPQGGPASLVARDALVLAVPQLSETVGVDGLTGRLVLLGLSETDVPAVSGAALGAFLTFAYAR